jgi:O-antigen ligase
LSWKWRGLLLALAGAWIYFRFGQQVTWLAGWLPTFIVLGVLVYMRSIKLTFIGLGVCAVLIMFNTSFISTIFEEENDESGHTRMAAWEVNWRVTGKHIIFGTGPAGYAAYYMSYYPKDAMATHSSVIDILAQTGLIGLGFCLWFFFRLAWFGYKLCLRLKGRNDFVEAVANAAFAGTVGCIIMMIFGDWIFPFTYTQTIAGFDYVVYSWLFMGAIVAIDRLVPANSEAVDHARPIYHHRQLEYAPNAGRLPGGR